MRRYSKTVPFVLLNWLIAFGRLSSHIKSRDAEITNLTSEMEELKTDRVYNAFHFHAVYALWLGATGS